MILPVKPSQDVKFSLGHLVITANAKDVLNESDVQASITRHIKGDWGDVCKEDGKANDGALKNGGRIFSVYHDKNKTKFYIITEADRSSTCVLLPEDY